MPGSAFSGLVMSTYCVIFLSIWPGDQQSYLKGSNISSVRAFPRGIVVWMMTNIAILIAKEPKPTGCSINVRCKPSSVLPFFFPFRTETV